MLLDGRQLKVLAELAEGQERRANQLLLSCPEVRAVRRNMRRGEAVNTKVCGSDSSERGYFGNTGKCACYVGGSANGFFVVFKSKHEGTPHQDLNHPDHLAWNNRALSKQGGGGTDSTHTAALHAHTHLAFKIRVVLMITPARHATAYLLMIAQGGCRRQGGSGALRLRPNIT